jgi:glutaredoxin
MFFARPFLALGLMGLLAAAGLSGNDANAQQNAQQIYRFVGSDGRVTFSDKAPLDASTQATRARVVALPAGSGLEALPFELRQTASRYPVTFYTGPNCGPCTAGRALLVSRGVPFTEKTVTSNEDIEALKRLAGAAALPFLTIGSQQLRGFSQIEWVQFLDAAGYPKTSHLPASYTASPATPLVAARDAGDLIQGAAAQGGRTAAPQPVPVQAPAESPTGIRF